MSRREVLALLRAGERAAELRSPELFVLAADNPDQNPDESAAITRPRVIRFPIPTRSTANAELELLDDSTFEYHEGDPSATLKLMIMVDGEDASRLARIAEARQQEPSQVLAELLRDADRPAA